ncbi:MAG: hypothetical protein PVF80_10630, partial [Gammaproteobacteria bacterium]
MTRIIHRISEFRHKYGGHLPALPRICPPKFYSDPNLPWSESSGRRERRNGKAEFCAMARTVQTSTWPAVRVFFGFWASRAAEEQGGFYCASGSSTQSYASAAQQEDITGVKSLAVASAAMARRNFARWREQYKPVRGRLFEF